VGAQGFQILVQDKGKRNIAGKRAGDESTKRGREDRRSGNQEITAKVGTPPFGKKA